MAKRIPDDDDDDDDDSEERSRFERIKRAFKRKLRDKGDTDKSLSENVPPKGNITVADKEEERPRSDRYTPLGIWKRRNGMVFLFFIDFLGITKVCYTLIKLSERLIVMFYILLLALILYFPTSLLHL